MPVKRDTEVNKGLVTELIKKNNNFIYIYIYIYRQE